MKEKKRTKNHPQQSVNSIEQQSLFIPISAKLSFYIVRAILLHRKSYPFTS